MYIHIYIYTHLNQCKLSEYVYIYIYLYCFFSFRTYWATIMLVDKYLSTECLSHYSYMVRLSVESIEMLLFHTGMSCWYLVNGL